MTQAFHFERLLTVSRMQHRVPRRTLAPHPAQHLRSFSVNITEHLFPFQWHSQTFIRV